MSFEFLPHDSLDRIANLCTIQKSFALGGACRALEKWWTVHITRREELLTKFVKHLLESTYTLEETTAILQKFSRVCDLPFELQISHHTFQQDGFQKKFQAVSKVFSNATSILYNRPLYIDPPEWNEKEVSGCLVTAKFATNILCNIGRALPCVGALGKELHNYAEQEIRNRVSDTALQEAHIAYPKLKKLSILVDETFETAKIGKIGRAISELPAFKELTAISIAHKHSVLYSNILELDSSEEAFSDLFLKFEKLESLEIPHCNHQWNFRSFRQFQSPHTPFQYIPEKLTKLSITLHATGLGFFHVPRMLPENTTLSDLLKRCKELKELTFALSNHNLGGTLLPDAPVAYPTLQKLVIKAPEDIAMNHSQALFATFTNLETLELLCQQDNFIYVRRLASSSSLKHLIIDIHGGVAFEGANIKERFPKLETITLTCDWVYGAEGLVCIQSIEPEIGFHSTMEALGQTYQQRKFYVYQIRAPEMQVQQ